MLADKGYDADAIRADLAERSIQAVIPAGQTRRVKIEHDRVPFKQLKLHEADVRTVQDQPRQRYPNMSNSMARRNPSAIFLSTSALRR